MTERNPADRPQDGPAGRRPGELGLRELARFAWRQITSMRTALVLLLLLALASVPGSVIPQERTDALKASQWQEKHETLTKVYDKLGLFDVYGSPWFAAIYLLLDASRSSAASCRGRSSTPGRSASEPPPAPRNLTRMPDHATYTTDGRRRRRSLEQARAVLRKRGYRLRAADGAGDAVSGERGYLREVGNLIFHLAVLVVLVGFALGGLFGYKGGVILVTGTTVRQQPDAVRRLRPGQPVPGRPDGRLPVPGRGLRRRLDDLRSRAPAWRATSTPTSATARATATSSSTTSGSTTRSPSAAPSCS